MMFNQYPYINVNDLNLDYILSQIKIMMNEVTNFVSINAIKYADPIQWDITRQYEKNTVVIDPVTGTAYISVAPVPAGVALTRPEYWTVVFDLGSFVTRAAQNFTSRYESETTLTATFPSNMGEWLVWGDVLYKALTNITAGDTYVVDGNIEHFTIEDVYNSYLNTIASILAIIGDLQDLTTSDTSSIVNAINSVLTDLNLTIGDLANLTTSDTSDIVNAINSVLTDMSTAISNVENYIDEHAPVNVLDFGVVGDGVTDDSSAFQNLVNDYDWLYIPDGAVILLSSTITIGRSIRISGSGSWAGKFKNGSTNPMFNITGRGVIIEGVEFTTSDYNTAGVSIDIGVGQGTITNCHFDYYNNGIRMNNTSMQTISNCFFEHGSTIGSAIIVGETQYCSGITMTGIRIFGTDNEHPYCGVLVNYADGVDLISSIINRTVYPMIVDPVANGFVHALRCVDVLFDYSDNGATITAAKTNTDIFNVTFNSCWFACSTTQTALALRGSLGTIQNINITQCEFIGGFYGFGVFYPVGNLILSECEFTDITNSGIFIDGSKDVKALICDVVMSASFSSASPITPLNGIQITGNNANRIIILDKIVCNTATNSALYTEYRNNIYVLNSLLNSGNYNTIGNTVNMPTGAPDGIVYLNTDDNHAYFMINGQLRTWTADKIMQGALADMPVNPAAGLLYYVTDRDEWRYSDTNNAWRKITKIKAGLLANRYTIGIDYGDRYFATDENRWYTYGSQGWFADTQSGTTANRPIYNLIVGTTYFDTTLNKPIWYNGSIWVDATGTSV